MLLTFLIYGSNLTPLLKKEIRFVHHDLLLKEIMLKPMVMISSSRFIAPAFFALPAALTLFAKD